MLVCSRKVGEEIYIGEDIRIVVTKIEGSIARIGIEAPKDIKIYRKEVYDKILLERGLDEEK